MNNQHYNTSLPPLEPGTVLTWGKYRYEILELTSNRGGFGRIYRAVWHYKENVRRFAAIKEFHVSEHEEAEWSKMHTQTRMNTEYAMDIFKAKFMEEAMALSKLRGYLQDEHTPKIIGSTWEEEDGRLFYAMYFINGLTLREMMEGYGRGYVMPEHKAVGYIIQVAKVLHKAHIMMGIYHADVSPNNIMVQNRQKDYAVLVDWGNANSYDDELTKKCISAELQELSLQFQDDVDRMTEQISEKYDVPVNLEDIVVGTSGYTAPPSFWGKPQRDVYSLGATLFYLLTGNEPEELYTDSRIAEARELLRKNGVSDTTVGAIIHAMNVDADEATPSIMDFMMELPIEDVVKNLLDYSEHNK